MYGACAQILGVDLLRTKDVRNTHKLVADHIAMVRTIPGLQNATAVLQLESNLALSVDCDRTRPFAYAFYGSLASALSAQ